MTSDKKQPILNVMHRQQREFPDRPELSRRESINARFFNDNFRNVQVAAMPSILIPGLLVDMFCFAYPAFYSLKALRNNNGSEIIQWISYWIISAFFMIIEKTIYFITLIPFYITIRRSVCIWCLLPIPNNGGTVTYNNVFRRLMNNETPSHVFRDVSRQLSLETLQRRAIELKQTVIEKMRAAQPEIISAAENVTANALGSLRGAAGTSAGTSNMS